MSDEGRPAGSRAIVVGAGVAGLAAAIRLRSAGCDVLLLERADHVGGKLREIEVGGRLLDAGPSVLTMRHVFDELFDGRLGDYVTLVADEPLCRHFFADGSRLDLFADAERSRAAIEAFAGRREADGYTAFREHAARIYEVVRKPFIENAIPSFLWFLHPRAAQLFSRIDGVRTLWKALEEYFADERLRALFGRYATYNGSSPFHAPATLAVITHVENAFGVFAVKGGMCRLAEALVKRARELGVTIATSQEVTSIAVERGRVRGVRLVGGETEKADLVIACGDAGHVYQSLLAGTPVAAKRAAKLGRQEPSLSAWVLLAVARRVTVPLVHHNVFFSSDYRREFDQMVAERRPPTDPTVYASAQDRGEPDAEPGQDGTERLFFLTNAAALPAPGEPETVDWSTESTRCRERVVATLARHGMMLDTVAERAITPVDWAARFPGSRGAIYGISSNTRVASLRRPTNRVRGIAGLYLAGGTAHPGAGIPMVALSARIAVGLALEDRRRGR